jgi:hypothetical protein
VYIKWCPSHQGIYGNKVADRLAKRGLKLAPISKPTISYSHLARRAKKAIMDEWQHMWAAVDDNLALWGYGNLYWLLAGSQPKISLKYKTFSENRAFQTAYIQLKTGVGSLKSHLRKIRKTLDSVCWCCGLQPQTTKHMLIQCSSYAIQRKEMKDALYGAPLRLQALFRTASGQKALEAFISSTKVCTAEWIQTANTVEG